MKTPLENADQVIRKVSSDTDKAKEDMENFDARAREIEGLK